jgi:hypothetical protein
MPESNEAERQMRTAFDARDYGLVYDAEIRGVLQARLRSEADGDEALSIFVEDLWARLFGFAWHCSARGWA